MVYVIADIRYTGVIIGLLWKQVNFIETKNGRYTKIPIRQNVDFAYIWEVSKFWKHSSSGCKKFYGKKNSRLGGVDGTKVSPKAD